MIISETQKNVADRGRRKEEKGKEREREKKMKKGIQDEEHMGRT